jgi:AraC-like DNA-binding protein
MQPALYNSDSIRAVRELRARIETLACAQAARHAADGADLSGPVEALQQFAVAIERKAHGEIYQADVRFHRSILELANIHGLVDAWNAVYRHEEGFHRETVAVGWPDVAVLLDLHRPILKAIESGDADAAEVAMRTHFDMIWYRLSNEPGRLSIKFDPLAVACAYIAMHLQEPLRLHTLARRVSRTSASHLARLFRKEYGISFTRYVHRARMNRAAHLLSNTRNPIHRCATAVGYKDPSRFSEHFARQFGVTPSAYRKTHRNTVAR